MKQRIARWPILVVVAFVQLSQIPINVMGKDILRQSKDTGVIGEKKTRVGKPVSDVMIYRANESFVTPLVIGDEALFGGPHLDLSYSFRFACVGWRYNIKAYLTNYGEEVGHGWIVDLQSPDKKTRVITKLVDLGFGADLQHPLTEDQIQQQRVEQMKLDRKDEQLAAVGIRVVSHSIARYSDSLNGEERIRGSKFVITRLLAEGVDGYKLREGEHIEFATDTVGNMEFVRGVADLYKSDVKVKCGMWALNVSGYRRGDVPTVRRGNTWICEVISTPSDFANLETKVRRILESLTFEAKNQNVYPDLRQH